MNIVNAWSPRPIVKLDGQTVADCTGEIDAAPVVIDGVTIDWGRDSYLDMPRPAHIEIDLLDRDGRWSNPANRSQIGTLLDLDAQPESGDAWRVFHGRLAAADYTPGPLDPDTAAPRYWIVHLTGVDITAQLGNIIIPDGTVWPAETAINRAIRLNDAGADTDIDAVYFRPDAVDWQMSPLDAGGKDLLTLIDTFYRSTGSTWAYNPVDNTLRDQFRLASTGMVTQLAVYPGAGAAMIFPGATTYEGKDGASDPATITYNGITIDGRTAAAADPAMDLAPTLDANRVECKWTDLVTDPSGNLHTTSYTTFNTHSWDATRTMRYDSWLADGVQIDPVLQQWSYRIMYEGSFPRHPDIVLDTRHGDAFTGFYWSTTPRRILRAGETPATVYIMGSRYSEAARHSTTFALATPPPTYSIIGGRIEWRSGWIVRCKLQTWYTSNPDAGTVSWSDLSNTALEWGGNPAWWETGTHPNTFTTSISWLDMSAPTTVHIYQ